MTEPQDGKTLSPRVTNGRELPANMEQATLDLTLKKKKNTLTMFEPLYACGLISYFTIPQSKIYMFAKNA